MSPIHLVTATGLQYDPLVEVTTGIPDGRVEDVEKERVAKMPLIHEYHSERFSMMNSTGDHGVW